jgi:Fibronectin type III domain/Hydrazine synthase alpha subunit middle domain
MRLLLHTIALAFWVGVVWMICVFFSTANAGQPSDMVCAESNPAFPTPVLAFTICRYPTLTVYSPAGYDTEYPVGFLVPTASGQYPITLHWDGYGDMTHCPDWSYSRPDQIIIKNCPDYYPHESTYKVGDTNPLGFGGPFFGLSPTERFTTAVRKVDQQWGNKVDWNAGLTLKGSSYGSGTSLLQTLLFDLVDPEVQARITKVATSASVTNFIGTSGLYANLASVRSAWEDFDLNLLDHAAQAEKLKHIYFFVVGSPADSIVPFRQEWFSEVCDANKISCYGLWHACGHALAAEACGGKFEAMQHQMFAGPNQNVRLDDPFLVVFTNSTANIYGPIGGYNLGLSWDNTTFYTDEYTARVGLRYLQLTDIHPSVPDQPGEASVSVTLRLNPAHSNISLVVGDLVEWSINGQTGQAVVFKENEVTLPITLPTSLDYSVLTVIKTGHVLSCLVAAQEPVPPGCGNYVGENHLIYTRQPRLSAPIVYKRWSSNEEAVLEEGAQWQDWYDAGEPDNFTNADLVYDDRKGGVTVLYDCTSGTQLCAAHDGRVSPDATKVVFTVSRGTSYRGILMEVYGIVWRATSYELWIHDLATGTNTKIDDNARMGEWCGNDCIVFASDRAGHYPPWANAGPDYAATGFDGKAKGLHIYRADYKDGKLVDPLDISPHAVSCLSPSVNLDGTVQASCWNGFDERGYKHTPLNMYWIEQFNGNGTGHRVTMNAHSSPVWEKKSLLTGICDPVYCGEGGTTFRVLRSQVPLRGDRFAVANYYRANHQGGLGTIFVCNNSVTEGFSRASNLPHVEPPRSTALGSGRFAPNCYVATPYGNDQDMHILMHKQTGKAMGKAGYPFPVPQANVAYGFTHCRGNCYSANEEPVNAKRATFGGEPTSKKEIRLAYTDVITDPFDPAQSECIAGCDEKWNAFDARVVTTYQNLYGKPEPDKHPAALTGTRSILNVVNAREGEIHKLNSGRDYDDCAIQGCADLDWQARITAIRITEIKPWLANPLRKGFSSTHIVGDFPLAADGSIAIDMACGFTYQLGGIDKDGNVVAQDHSLHHAICGETVTCHGCHDAHSEERLSLYSETAEERFMSTIAGSKIIVPVSVPPLPVITSVESDDSGLLVRFTLASDGGSPITDYTVTCGDQSASGGTSPIIVGGLVNDQEYSCSVVATNSVGNSQPSSPASGRPEEMIPAGLPIWLLYEATKARQPPP